MNHYSKKRFRQSIIGSIFVIMLSLTSLIGGTLAWFTDTETISSRIVSGNLDVEMYYQNSYTDGEYENVKDMGEHPYFFVDSEGNDILWEPGVVSVCDLKVVNKGNLALQYKLSTVITDENDAGLDVKLSDVIKAIILPKAELTSRTDAIQAGDGAEDGWLKLTDIKDEDTLEAEGENEFTIVLYWKPTDHDNDYNMQNTNAGKEISIKVDFSLIATQYTSEDDAFGTDYDAIE